ncbi:MAG: SUF system Fe-S cluster assembly regulator [Rhodocyclales bacterium]|nr:SUF system Fe-S cluster assembly regulator [Rhodocyclales bacterium]
MLRMSKLTDYGTVIMAYMARRPRDVHSVAELAAVLGMAAPTTSKILKRLARHELVQSSRGAKGGYRLARPPEAISLADVIDAMEGPFGLTECSAVAGLCLQEAGCPLRDNWQRVNQVIRRTLDGVTLAEMSRPALRPAAQGAVAAPQT